MANKNNSSLGESNDDFIEFDYTDKHQADNKYVSKRRAKQILATEKTKSTEPMSHKNTHSPIGADNKYVSKRRAKQILATEKTKSTEPMSHKNTHSPIGVPKRTIKRILNQQTKSSIRPKFNTDNEHDDYDLGDYEESY